MTKGPSLVTGEKRLAVQTEDHPLEYGDFEGTIPKGGYGGGTVIVWDKGSWMPHGDPHKSLAKGHLEFELYGKKLGGRWHLIGMTGKPSEKRENRLLIKGEDDAARPEGARPTSLKSDRKRPRQDGSSTKSKPRNPVGPPGRARSIDGRTPRKASKKTDRAAGEISTELEPAFPDPSILKGAKKAPLPAFIERALATLVSKPPSGSRWLHEIKFDGYRLEARIEAGRIKLSTRSELDWTQKFGKDIIEAFKDLPVGTAVIDGELSSRRQALRTSLPCRPISARAVATASSSTPSICYILTVTGSRRAL
ncbi:DNA polymerase ligase N-terminal domain-containing protein [Rhizobium lusitanum]|uniref:DNA polymerase ligase N-terminal domain-containing protein n=1 Tax=Rhizobium lusitanum TaxID=293958 RepID=UPI0032B20940